ncbi:MAG: hypothetical protein ABI970_23130, partial [Chloroflexota bacterium]
MIFLKLNLNRQRMFWLMLVTISVVGVITAYIDQNIFPLLVTLFAVTYLIARLIKETPYTYKGFLGRFGFAVLILMVGVGAFNYVVNPFSLYPTNFFDPIGLTTRNLKMGIYATSPRPNIVILGNSRSFTVDTVQVTKLWHTSALNLSVAAGTTQDDLALLHFMMEQGKMPSMLIISLSPDRLATFDFRLLEPNSLLLPYRDDNSQISSLQFNIDRWTFLFSKEQTEASERIVQSQMSGVRPPPIWTFDNTGVTRNQTSEPLSDDFAPEVLEKSSWIRMFTEALNPNIEAAGMIRFKQILDIAKAQNMLVIGYAPPIHPLFKAFLDTHTDFERIRSRINEQINALTKSYTFYFTDFMDDERF